MSKLWVISVFLADTSLQPRLSTSQCHVFVTAIGTPKDESDRTVLLTDEMDVALRGLRWRLPTRPPADASFPFDVEYADDTDFISLVMFFPGRDRANQFSVLGGMVAYKCCPGMLIESMRNGS